MSEVPAEHRNARGNLDVDGLIARGWAYRDLPGKLSPEMWDLFISLLGDAPHYILIGSEGRDATGPWKRGQFLLSPDAMANIAAYSKAKRDEKAAEQDSATGDAASAEPRSETEPPRG